MKKIIAILLLLVSTAEAQIGRHDTRVLIVSPNVTSGAYSAGDIVGGLLTLSNAFPTISKKGRITSIDVIDDAGQTAAYEFCSFKANPSSIGADNAAYAPSKADLLNKNPCIEIPTTDRFAQGARASTSVASLNSFVESNTTTLYGVLVDRTGRTGASTSDITLVMTILID